MSGFFKKAVSFVFEREGGYSHHPADRGGATNLGITQRTYDQFRKNHPNAVTPDWPTDVKHLTRPIAELIYEVEYWFAGGCDKLAWPLCLCHFDAYVNHRPTTARMFLSKCNGRWESYLALRRAFFERLIQKDPTQAVFRKGWMNRLTHVEAACQLPA